MTEQKKANQLLDKSDPALRALYILLLRVNQLAANNGFLITSLIEELDSKGVIKKSDIEASSRQRGYSVINQMDIVASKMEKEVFGEDIHQSQD